MKEVTIIAELGWNWWSGGMILAKEMISAAVESGADICKFQTFAVKRLKPGDWDTDGRREIYKQAELTLDKHLELAEYCDKVDVQFLSAAFSIEDAKTISQVTTKAVKIPGFESRNHELLDMCSDTFDHVYLSTGTSSTNEIQDSMTYLSYFNTTLLHCVSAYPCPIENANLIKIRDMENLAQFIGFSDHCLGVEVAKISLEYGVSVIEKHFTLSHDLPGKDNTFSILPHELKSLKDYINIRDRATKQHSFATYQECEADARLHYVGKYQYEKR